MALAAALTVLMALLPAGLASRSDPTSLKVTCEEKGSTPPEKVTADGTVLTVLCPDSCTIDPPVNTRDQQVCKDDKCGVKDSLTKYSEGATAAAATENSKKGITITFKELPKTKQTFYLNCKTGNDKKCHVEVILDKPTTGTPDAVPEPPSGSVPELVVRAGSEPVVATSIGPASAKVSISYVKEWLQR